MKKIHLSLIIAALAAVWTFAANVEPASAVSFFKKGFEARYVGEEPSTDAQKSIAAALKTTKCYVCHVKGQKKKVRNAYGDALSKLLKAGKLPAAK